MRREKSMNLVGRVIGNRYEIIEKLAKAEWQLFTKQNVIF